MNRLPCKMGWEIVREEWPDFKGEIFKNRPGSVVELLENAVRKYPDKVGFITEDRRLSYKEFDGLVNRIASGLSKHGVKKGEYVALLLGTQLDFPLSFFALQYHSSKEKDSLGIEKTSGELRECRVDI